MIATATPVDLAGYDPIATRGDCHYDEDAAQIVIDFFCECLQHIDGQFAAEPFIPSPWQDQILRTLFGWKRPDGSRRYRNCYIEVPRKNGKSTLAAGIAIYLLMCDGEVGGQIYSVAGNRDQASLVFNIAAAMIKREPVLSRACKIRQSVKRVIVDGTNSFYRAIAANAEGAHGYNPHGILFDELHVQPNRDLWDAMQTGKASTARRQPLTVAISTAGFDRNSICWEQHQYATNVGDGVIEDPYFLPVLYAADVDDDWTDEDVWAKANPGLDVSVSRDYLREECAKAQHSGQVENTFKRLHLNIWTEQDVRWLSMDRWRACGGALPDLAGRDCFGGLDLSSTLDVSALILVFPLEDESVALVCKFWIPEENMRAREKRDRVPYRQWAREGFVTPTEGNVIDYEVIRADANKLAEQYVIRELAFDPYNATQIVTQLEGDGLEMIACRQGFLSLSPPSKDLEKRVIEGTIHHGDNPVLTWMAGNVAVRTDPAGNIKPVKPEHHSAYRIDGIVGGIMGLSRLNVSDELANIYDERGPIFL